MGGYVRLSLGPSVFVAPRGFFVFGLGSEHRWPEAAGGGHKHATVFPHAEAQCVSQNACYSFHCCISQRCCASGRRPDVDDVPEDQDEAGILLKGEENVARRLKLEREARGWSTTAVSDRMNDAGFEMNPSAVWRIENGKRRINLDEAIGFADVFGVSLPNFVGPPRLAAKARALELIDDVVRAFRDTQRANAAFTRARDAFDSYLADHPDIREEAEVVISNAIAEVAMEAAQSLTGPPEDAESSPHQP